MQTFLPYPEFDRSAAALDPSRLGKQRVEVLQILRAITLESYGWANHPATQMWRGYVPALVSYGLAMVDAWVGLGAADSTRGQIAEFAPQAAAKPQPELAMPRWLGDEALHRSHQSNLIRKDAAYYGPQFPGIPHDLPYVWPGPDATATSEAALTVGAPLVIVRPRDDQQLADWVDAGQLTLGEQSPAGKVGPKWRAQLARFGSLPTGTRFAVLEPSGQRLVTGVLTGEIAPFADEREFGLRRSAQFEGELRREDFPYPALLQDPRSLFEVTGPPE